MKKLIFLLFLLPAFCLMGQTGDQCKLTLTLLNGNNEPIAMQKFKLSYADGSLLGEFITNTSGQSVIQVKQNSGYIFETLVNGRSMKTEFSVEDESQVQFDLQLAIDNSANSDSVKVIFRVTDEKSIVESEAKITVKEGNNVVFSCTTDVDGYCFVTLLKSKDYDLVVEKFGKTFNIDFDLPDDPALSEFTYRIKIKVVERYTRTYVLENVYFDYNKWDIKPESNASLNNLYDELSRNPQMKIELAGHTDSDGDDAFNMQLSQRRADAVKNYLIKKGIAANRILTKGYGETTPIATNETSEGKAKNRRTEVKVISE
jgi:OOP family OmpA-OmpF porin